MKQTHIELRYKEPFSYLIKYDLDTKEESPVSFISGKIIGGEMINDQYPNGNPLTIFRVYLEEPDGNEIKLSLKSNSTVLYGLSSLFSADINKPIKVFTANKERDGKEYTNLLFSQGGKYLPPTVFFKDMSFEAIKSELEKQFNIFISKL